jgi:AraC family transcriptional regulator
MVPEPAGRFHLGRVPAAHNPDGFRVRIRDLPARTVAYIRVLDPYRGDAVAKATQRLITWAERNSLGDGQWLGYQWDNPEITSLEDCQYHVAVEAERFVPDDQPGFEAWIGRPFAHGTEHFELFAQLPIKRA